MTNERIERARDRRHRATEDIKRDGVHPLVAAFSLLCVVALVAAIGFGSMSHRTAQPMAINGDDLGPAYDEKLTGYVNRSNDSLADAKSNDPEARRWALVSFNPAADVNTAAAAVDGIDGLRVAKVTMGGGAAVGIPEPTAGETRVDVFNRVRQLTAPMAGFDWQSPDLDFTGLLVYANADQLQQIADRPQSFAVQALPTDARIGKFGVSPVVDSQAN